MIDLKEPPIWFGVQTLRLAAALAKNVQADLGGKKITKADLSPVTVADFAIQALVGQALRKTFTEESLVGEESAKDLQDPNNTASLYAVVEHVGQLVPGATTDSVCNWVDVGGGDPSGRFWTLDPVDGTKGYLRGGHYAVALALIIRGRVELGFLACPLLNTRGESDESGGGALFLAQRGMGAWALPLNDANAEPVPLHVSGVDKPKMARMLRSVESGHTNVGEIDHIAMHLESAAATVQMDSQAKYAVLAGGGGELLFRLLSPGKEGYKERIWDQAAGAIILEEAGGKITDLYGKPLDFGQGHTLANNTGVFASNGALHKAGLDAIKAVCKLP